MNTKKNDIDIEDAEIITEKATSQGGVEPNLNYSPFDEPVKQRDYTKPIYFSMLIQIPSFSK